MRHKTYSEWIDAQSAIPVLTANGNHKLNHTDMKENLLEFQFEITCPGRTIYFSAPTADQGRTIYNRLKSSPCPPTSARYRVALTESGMDRFTTDPEFSAAFSLLGEAPIMLV